MSRVLLVCPEPLGHRHPAGVGIRFLEFARALLAVGHSVTMLSPDGGKIAGCKSEQITPTTLRDQSELADVAILQGHVANDFLAHAREIPTVIDLYDPYIVENLHYSATLGEQVYRHDHITLIGSLRRGDYFLCASEAQRFFYLGMLLALGRLNPETFTRDPKLDTLLGIVPFGVQTPRLPLHKDLSIPRIIFGGIYDWYDPILAIEATRIGREKISGLTLTFTSHPNADVTPQEIATVARQYVSDHQYQHFIIFDEWVPYDDRAAYYDRFALAMLTFRPSLETDLAMRTRIFDYLWAGLPVVTSSARGTDLLIEQYDAGTVVRSNDPAELARAVVATLTAPGRYEANAHGAIQYATDHQWPLVLRPLLEYCEEPRFDITKHHFDPESFAQAGGRSLLQRLKRKIGGVA